MATMVVTINETLGVYGVPFPLDGSPTPKWYCSIQSPWGFVLGHGMTQHEAFWKAMTLLYNQMIGAVAHAND